MDKTKIKWKVLHAGISLFIVSGHGSPIDNADVLYEKMLNSKPDSFQTFPNNLNNSTASGDYNKIQVSCNVSSNRINFSLSSLSAPIEKNIPYINSKEDSINVLLLIINNIKSFATENKKIYGFGFTLRIAVVDCEENSDANNIIMSAIPPKYRPNLTDEKNFILQINQPREFFYTLGSDKVEINSVKKWSVEDFVVLSILGNPLNLINQSENKLEPKVTIKPVINFEENNMPFSIDKNLNKYYLTNIFQEALSNFEKFWMEINNNEEL
jgi:hypothetical protein